MKAALIGCGAIAGRWIRSLLADGRIEIAVLVDPDQQAAHALADRYELSPVFATTLDETLTLAPVDVVVNLTPPDHHYSVSRESLAHGLHVLTEKPLALSLPDALDLVHLARERGLLLAVMQNRGTDPGFLAFCATVHLNAEPPFAITTDTLVTLPSPGFRSSQHLPVTTDLAVHALDQVRALITAPPTEVTCTETPTGFLAPHSAIATIIVRFADGSLFTYRGGYIADPLLRTDANGDWRVEAHDFASRWAPDPTSSRKPAEPGPPAYQRCITAMVDALHQPGTAPVPAVGNLGSIALLDAALRSAASRRPVPVPEVPDVRP
ncbi:Gfo/Idh/MocA family protein [Kitasatospora purpeofusca]|uniref:Gfo/Idh/MocA family protein n=1 Tax=Kitasatospora purpeofusca TaxID=67352 RepID=UPI00224E7DEA|nr:Gfo/Idh/MocA family oxidoreductase [Kitasatospora purpeofusca]MCX4753480.1 Gfo/Idh/MocA family oxidoreductase [Kitasatospora purpeofusca]WSR32976.1 Gfo/Idh/MocA family oxidoreductase [Kitasatospora purpeofusca]